MSLYNGPPRPGARGGRGEFSWESVKADKDREFYLGHSVKALTGRWQKGKDVYWYTRDKGGDDVARAEIEAVKQREKELMDEVPIWTCCFCMQSEAHCQLKYPYASAGFRVEA